MLQSEQTHFTLKSSFYLFFLGNIFNFKNFSFKKPTDIRRLQRLSVLWNTFGLALTICRSFHAPLERGSHQVLALSEKLMRHGRGVGNR